MRHCEPLGARRSAWLPSTLGSNVISWIGIGDVDGIVVPVTGPRKAILSRGGVVGYQLPPLRCVDLPVAKGDTLILATDGVNSGFTATQLNGRQPRPLANNILLHHGKTSDDALVLVVRYQGAQS